MSTQEVDEDMDVEFRWVELAPCRPDLGSESRSQGRPSLEMGIDGSDLFECVEGGSRGGGESEANDGGSPIALGDCRLRSTRDDLRHIFTSYVHEHN